MAAGIGLLMGCVGSDPINGMGRFTFGNYNLYGGISTVAQMLGMFAMCQIIRDNAKGSTKMPDCDVKNMKGLGVSFKDIFDNIKTILFAFFVGLWIGFLPGMGSGISNMVAYGYAKSISKEPETFGKGNPSGVWASETANNASLGGALIPMMALGIPGDGITAMLIAALTIHGLQAGPLFMVEQHDLAMLIFACVLVSAIVTYLIQIITKRWFPYILKIPYHYLYTVILVISFIGGYVTTDEAYYKNYSVEIVIWYLKNIWEPSLCYNLDKICNDCRDKYTCKDKHSQIMLLNHKKWSSLETMDGQSCNKHGCNTIARNTESHHRNEGATEGSVVCRLTGPNTGRVTLSEGFRLLADALCITIGYHVGNT